LTDATGILSELASANTMLRSSKALSSSFAKKYRTELRFLDEILAEPDAAENLGSKDSRFGWFSRYREEDDHYRTVMAALQVIEVSEGTNAEEIALLWRVIKVLARKRLPFESPDVERWLEVLAKSPALDPSAMPVAEVIAAVESRVGGSEVPKQWRSGLSSLHATLASAAGGSKSIESLITRLEALLDDSLLARLKPDEGWADKLQKVLSGLNDEKRGKWELLLQRASEICPEPPAVEWEVALDELEVDIFDERWEREYSERILARVPATAWWSGMSRLIGELGSEHFKELLLEWLQEVPNSKPGYLSRQSANRETLRGLLWCCTELGDARFAAPVRNAGEFLYRKNSPLGTACVQVLTRLPADAALHELGMLLSRVKANSRQRLIRFARNAIAEAAGLSADAVDDLTIPSFDFEEFGRRRDVLSGYTAQMEITDGNAELRWFKPDGRPQKSVPAIIKREHAQALRSLKTTVKDLRATLSRLGQRIESSVLERRNWKHGLWLERFFDHSIAGTLVRRLIWEVATDNETKIGAVEGNQLVTIDGERIDADRDDLVTLWHPIHADADAVLAWREWLISHEVRQPFKQAHREIYLLTDAERTTRRYSNRFAAHVLRQSQFRTLAKSRGWGSDYLGPWDSGADGVAVRELPAWDLRAEFWLAGADGEYGGAGGYAYISTDQVRFYERDSSDPLPLADLPPLVFSEIMRDVDLFVGVASVGNDPNWADGGPQGRYVDYWQSYSFGDLSATAQTRKEVLQRLVPRLKIAGRCSFSDKFLVVQGGLRTYKIHLGSGNILMSPNDEYLCIVPARGGAKGTDGVFLPFEGDQTLSIILSKAFLLAEDTKITDPTIVSQIRR
jgi:Domain of unknown function (DUF4132)